MSRRGGNATSARHRPKDSRDFYGTPPEAVRGMLPYAIGLAEPARRGLDAAIRLEMSRLAILEPSAGRGGIIEGLIAAGADTAKITAVEIDPGRCDVLRTRFPSVRVVNADFAEWSTNEGAYDYFDLVPMNPPYAAAERHIRLAIEHLKPGGTCSALMRQGFLAAGQGRAGFRAAHPHDRVELGWRLSFTAEILKWASEEQLMSMRNGGESTVAEVRKRMRGTDAADYAWGLFGEGRGGRFWTVEEP